MKFVRCWLSVLLVMAWSGLIQAETTYSVGVVPQFDVRQIEVMWRPLLQQLSQRSGVRLELVVSPDIPEFERQFETGKFHFAYMNSYHAIVANRSQGYLPLVRDVNKQLNGIVVVRKDSPITLVDQLDGRVIAMPAPNALAAALLPRAEFANAFKIEPVIRYVRSHDSVYLNVAVGAMDAGAGVARTLQKQPLPVRNRLRVLHQTRSVATYPLMAHPAVPEDVRKRLQEAFIELGQSAEGKALLAGIPMVNPGIASQQDYQSLTELGLERFYARKGH